MNFKTKPKLKKSKGFPVKEKGFPEANKVANKLEKKKYGAKKFKETVKQDTKLPKGEIAAHVTSKGKIEVSKRIPKSSRAEDAYHDKIEFEYLKKRKK